MVVVINRSTIDAVPRREHVPTADQRVRMHDVSWDTFETILRSRGDRPGPKMTYLDGELELMSPSMDHEHIGRTIGSILDVYFAYLGLVFRRYGSWTIKQRKGKAGLEPDECYVWGVDAKARPDLAIEVVWTSGGIDKLKVYRELGVPEVWFWVEGAITFHVLTSTGYELRDRSAAAPGIEVERIYRLLETPTGNELVKALRAEFPIP